jgi:hypothetical protein
VARARLGDLRPVHIADVPRSLTVDQMAPLRKQTGLPKLGGPEPRERYVLLRDGNHIPRGDVEFHPSSYLDETT